jgi:hypothetical protein
VVPVLYTYLYALGERAKRWFGPSPDEEEATLPH